jgi:hypothetical protein
VADLENYVLDLHHSEIEASNHGIEERLASFEGTLPSHEVVAIYIALAKAADLNKDVNALRNGEILLLCFGPSNKY